MSVYYFINKMEGVGPQRDLKKKRKQDHRKK